MYVNAGKLATSSRNESYRGTMRATVFGLLIAILARGQDTPSVSEQISPLQVITVEAKDGQKTVAVIRKPPGKGPFPVLIYLHGGLEPYTLKRLKEMALEPVSIERFLAAGYMTVNPTYRRRRADPQTPGAMWDCLAVIEHVKKMPEVDKRSVVIYGTSGGGSLALELAGETKLAAIAAEEPATVLFTGVFTSGTDLEEVMADPKRFYTPALRKFTQRKIRRISCPILIANGNVHVINKINNEIFVPALKAAGKTPELIEYPGENHGFSHGHGSPEAARKFFKDSSAFFSRYLPTQPKPIQ